MIRQKQLTHAIVVLGALVPAAAPVAMTAPVAMAATMAETASNATAPAAFASAPSATQPAGTPAGTPPGKRETAKSAARTPAGAPAEIERAAVGAWSADLPAASGPGRVVTLILAAPDRAELSSDHRDGKPPIVKTGTWQAKPGGAITVTLPDAPARATSGPEVLRFQLQGDALSAIAYDTEAWGKEGLRLVKKGGAAGGSAGSAAKLRGTLWRLIELRGADGAVVKPDDPEKYTFELESDGRVGVRADCNRGMGRYALEGGTLTFTVLAYTKAMCPPGSLYDSYTQALEKTASFAIKDGALTLTLAADAGAMTFEPAK